MLSPVLQSGESKPFHLLSDAGTGYDRGQTPHAAGLAPPGTAPCRTLALEAALLDPIRDDNYEPDHRRRRQQDALRDADDAHCAALRAREEHGACNRETNRRRPGAKEETMRPRLRTLRIVSDHPGGNASDRDSEEKHAANRKRYTYPHSIHAWIVTGRPDSSCVVNPDTARIREGEERLTRACTTRVILPDQRRELPCRPRLTSSRVSAPRAVDSRRP